MLSAYSKQHQTFWYSARFFLIVRKKRRKVKWVICFFDWFPHHSYAASSSQKPITFLLFCFYFRYKLYIFFKKYRVLQLRSAAFHTRYGLNIYGYLKFLLEHRPSKDMIDLLAAIIGELWGFGKASQPGDCPNFCWYFHDSSFTFFIADKYRSSPLCPPSA